MCSKILNEEAISDIILCEPITRKGREALERLELATSEIDIPYFYNNLCVDSKYDANKKYEMSDKKFDHNHLYYQYTIDAIQFKAIQERLNRFNLRFCSDSPNEYPLLMLGVAGNGKSIEINRRIRETYEENKFESGRAYFDLEEAFTKITYGDTYQCPDNTPLWIFSIKLLDGIMQYIKVNHLQSHTILNNFIKIIVKNNLANDKEKNIFNNIGNYYYGNNLSEKKVFCSLKNILTPDDVEKNIQILLEILMLVMYCSAPNRKHYIVIDNIEQYIRLNNLKIQIPNSDITKLYKSINMAVMNATYTFNRIEEDLGWKAFKIIIVLRRTSLGLLDSTFLHSSMKEEQNITDITGHFQVSDIWWKKKKHILKKVICNKYKNEENENIIKIVDNIMNDGTQSLGMDYQSMIAPLMSYGIRRNAKAQAHAAYSTYKILTNGNKENINLNQFENLMDAISPDNTQVRYMFRRALIEFQFKWSISSERKERWINLGIGHLTGEKVSIYNGKKIITENVTYQDTGCVTLMRRILTYLSYFPEKYNEYTNGQYKTIVDMFSTRSIYELIEGVLVNPLGDVKISDNDFLQLARVLIALSDMLNADTKSAPYVILCIKDAAFHRSTDDKVFAEILNKIWNSGFEESLTGKKYDCSDFGVRITDAGNSFLLDWQASFSFMASLYCFTIPSLFFLKDISSIKYVIETVYTEASKLCEMYEKEAKRFCGENVTLKTGTYLPKANGKYITFKQRVKELHMNHLYLYKDYIEKNYTVIGISENNMYDLTSDTGFINKYINKYYNWNTMEGSPECF